jgi:hypothetical protein
MKKIILKPLFSEGDIVELISDNNISGVVKSVDKFDGNFLIKILLDQNGSTRVYLPHQLRKIGTMYKNLTKAFL